MTMALKKRQFYQLLAYAMVGCLCWGAVTAWAQTVATTPLPMPPVNQFMRITRDPVLLQALQLLWRTGEYDCVNTLLKKPVRLVIKPLATLDPALVHYDAISWISPEGQQYVFINTLHQTAPPAALAALIGHEMLHDDEHNSLQEEVFSWGMEAQLWQKLSALAPPALATSQAPHNGPGRLQRLIARAQGQPSAALVNPENHPLVKRLNQLVQAQQTHTLEAMVRQHPAYRRLPETSPGYSGLEKPQ
jgi:hypothetical protein